jgi:hypothetical protein
MFERGGQLTEPDDRFIFEQWALLSQSAKAEAAGIVGEIDRLIELLAATRDYVLKNQQRREALRQIRNEQLTQCAKTIGAWRCGNRFDGLGGESFCHIHRKREDPAHRQPYEGWPTKTKAQPTTTPSPSCGSSPPRQSWSSDHTSWRMWRSSVEEIEPVVPVRSIRDDDEHSDHMLAETVERRARAIMSWAPWARRARHRSRRYEGFRHNA